ncbi:hypothetical protein TRIP_B350371 [uncultured Desulfatiglans sp.]|nr:hypothetical protein TRIP_B350371 [uncultured Desulfatiglans sp.]
MLAVLVGRVCGAGHPYKNYRYLMNSMAWTTIRHFFVRILKSSPKGEAFCPHPEAAIKLLK